MLIDWLTLRIKLDVSLGKNLHERILGCMGYTLCFDSDYKEKWRKHALDIDKLRSDSQGLYWSITADGQGHAIRYWLIASQVIVADGHTLAMTPLGNRIFNREVAHSEELCEQAAEEFTKAWRMLGTSQLKLGRLYANYDFDLASFDSGLIVAGLSKLYSRSLSEQAAFLKLKRNTGLLVMDEAHQAIAPTYNHLLDMLAPQGGSTSLLGLSATPGRSWLNVGEDEKLANLFCRQKVTLSTDGEVDPITFLQEMGYLAKPEYIWLPYFPTLQLSQAEINDLASGLDITPKTLAKLGDDVQRNILIIKSVMEHVVRGKKLIVFACSVEQAHSQGRLC
ncbi:MAG TPA: DEAD/DEAH box helicase family protein [Gallionella sp.]|nr:DEAD/DEAH box helicase family protein [Gallionella sp.]